MRSHQNHLPSRHRAAGFSLLELSIVVAILGVVSVMGLEAAANFVNRTNGQVTRERLVALDDALVRFFRIYGRLPCPSVRSLAPSNTSYGLEDCTITAITAASTPAGSNAGGGIMAGAIPFRALNIPAISSIDGFGSKFNYIVTKNLTLAGGSSAAAPTVGRFGTYDTNISCTSSPAVCPDATSNDLRDNIGMGGIEVRFGVLEQACTSGSKCQIVANPTYATTNTAPNGAAYIIFSSGVDRKGAMSARGVELADCVNSGSSTDGFKIDAQNCAYLNDGLPYTSTDVAPKQNAAVVGTIPVNVFYDSRFNTGMLSKNYFDDYVIWRTKGRL